MCQYQLHQWFFCFHNIQFEGIFHIYIPEYNKIVSLACYFLTNCVSLLLMPHLLLKARKALATIHPLWWLNAEVLIFQNSMVYREKTHSWISGLEGHIKPSIRIYREDICYMSECPQPTDRVMCMSRCRRYLGPRETLRRWFLSGGKEGFRCK